MSPRKRPVIAWIRIVHRWISMAFVVVAAVALVGVLPAGAAFDIASSIAIVLLLSLLLTGIWMAVHHYVAKSRAAKRRVATAG